MGGMGGMHGVLGGPPIVQENGGGCIPPNASPINGGMHGFELDWGGHRFWPRIIGGDQLLEINGVKPMHWGVGPINWGDSLGVQPHASPH